MRRKEVLAVNQVYHVFNKSIADFKIFNSTGEYERMKNLIRYYQVKMPQKKFTYFLNSDEVKQKGFSDVFSQFRRDKTDLCQIIAYCLMPTHIHLVLKQLEENGISIFMGNILNSYTRYFNEKHKRRGPLWQGRFKNVVVNTDEQLIHLTRYVHLNPVTAYFIEAAQFWPWSSYKEYLLDGEDSGRMCQYHDLVSLTPDSYREFVEDNKSYQRELGKIKHLLIEEPTNTPGVLVG